MRTRHVYAGRYTPIIHACDVIAVVELICIYVTPVWWVCVHACMATSYSGKIGPRPLGSAVPAQARRAYGLTEPTAPPSGLPSRAPTATAAGRTTLGGGGG